MTSGFYTPNSNVKIINNDNNNQLLSAMKEVENELKSFTPTKDYLKHLPPVTSRTFLTPIIEYEQSCIENNKAHSKYQQIETDDLPTSNSIIKDEDLESWTKSLNRIKIKLEYKQRQLAELELIKNFGNIAWKHYLDYYDNNKSIPKDDR